MLGSSSESLSSSEDENEGADVFTNLKKYLKLPNLDEILCESKSLDVLIMEDMGDSNIVEGLIGTKLSEMSRTSESESEIVVYRARREGIDVTLWNVPGLSFDQSNYTQEIKKILKKIDLKILYLGHCSNENFVITISKHITDVLGPQILYGSVIVVPRDEPLVEDFLGTLMRRIICGQIGAFSSKCGGVEISTILFKETDIGKEIIVVDPDLPVSYSAWHSSLFFDCISFLSSQNAKGSLLKLNMKRFKYVPRGREKVVPVIQYAVEESPLTFTIYKPIKWPSPLCIRLNDGPGKNNNNVPVMPDELSPPEPPPPQLEEDDTKSEGVDELTHFYTGTHDLQFGAHGGATPTSTGEHTTADKQ